MSDKKLYIGSHAPFWHDGSSIAARSYHLMLAALPAVLLGIYQYGVPALRVVALSVGSAILWELLLNRVMKRPVTIGDGNAAVIGLLLSMLLPATTPWWAVLVGTFVAIIVGKQIYGGIGCNPLNPTLVGFAILMLSWKGLLDFDAALVNYDLGFYMLDPLTDLKAFGPEILKNYSLSGLLLGQQVGWYRFHLRARVDRRRRLSDPAGIHPLGDIGLLYRGRLCHRPVLPSGRP